MSTFLTVGLHFLLLISTFGATPYAGATEACASLFPTVPKAATSSKLTAAPDRASRTLHSLFSEKISDPQVIESSLIRLIESHFSVPESTSSQSLILNSNNWSDLPPSVRQILESISLLKPTQRQQLLARVWSSPSQSVQAESYTYLIRLGLYESKAWDNLISTITDSISAPDTLFINEYLPFLSENMPNELRQKVLSQMSTQYQNLKKKYSNQSLGPKRVVDFYFKWLLRGDQIIVREIESGSSPQQALQTYFSEVHKYISPKGGIDFDETLRILQEIQENMPSDRTPHPFGKNLVLPAIYLGGSVPNGRAIRATSDFDLSSRYPFTDIESRHFADTISRWAGHRFSRPKFSIYLADLGSEEVSFWQQLHPIVIRITSDSLEMLVFDPHYGQEQVQNYRTYKLK